MCPDGFIAISPGPFNFSILIHLTFNFLISTRRHIELSSIIDVSRRKSSRKKEVHTSSVNTADFMTSIQKIYSPEELLTLSKTLAKLTNLIRPPITTPPKVSELIPVMEILRLHLPLLSTLIGLYVSFFPKLFQDQ